jgi:hypothetical protein
MKKNILFVVISAVVLTAGYALYKKSTTNSFAEHRIHSTTIVHLLTNPKKYEGKVVSIFGLLSTNSKLFPSVYINEQYAKANDISFSILISSNSTVNIQDQNFNTYTFKSIDIIDGCFVNITGNIVDGSALRGDITIIIDDECKKRFEKSDITIKGTTGQ